MRDEYDFAGGTRGKYAARYAEGSNIVVLKPAIAAAFPTSKAVNDALGAILGIHIAHTPRRRVTG